jgi:predicted  nucleic acid-binding Zn-ribbon protein
VEAARVPQQLLGELFVEKGLITRDELAEALAEQKDSGKRIGQILVQKGFVSRPELTTVLAEQLGVVLAKQEGFGAGLWSEIKRRHPRGRIDEGGEPEPVEPARPPEAQDLRLALIDELDNDGEPVPGEAESLRQQLAFASTRLEEERAGHKGTLRLLEESRRELERFAREVEDWRDRAVRNEDPDEKEQAAARLAELEETVTELRAELDARDRELSTGGEVQTQLAAEAGRLEDELKALHDQHRGSKDAIAALTAQVDEQRAGAADSLRLLDEARAEVDALQATVGELHTELDRARKEGSKSQAAVAALTAQVDENRASVDELARRLDEARADSAAFEATIGELREELSSREKKAEKSERKLRELRAELAAGEEARSREAAARVAAEAEVAKLQSDVRALSESLAETRAAHVAARREVGRLESRCAELEPLEALLAEANAHVAARTQSLAELNAELEAVRAELAERPEPLPVEEPAATHIVFVPSTKGYALAELPGPTPEPGAYEDVDDGRFLVSRIGPSPLPADQRRCAYLEVA